MRALDYVRAGGLAAGIATAVGLVVQGAERTTYWGHPDWVGLSVLFGALLGVAVAILLGYAAPPPSLIARIGLTIPTALAVGGLEIGLAFLLAKNGLKERNLPPVFAVIAIALIVWGVRRLPANRPLRHGLIAVAASLLVFRSLVAYPPALHAIERRVAPLTDARVRADFDESCGLRCSVAKVVVFTSKVHYDSDDNQHVATATARAMFETTTPHLFDGCGAVYTKAPEQPPWITKYKTTKECFAARPINPTPFSLWGGPPAATCCIAELSERKVGDRFDATTETTFQFHQRKWIPRGY